MQTSKPKTDQSATADAAKKERPGAGGPTSPAPSKDREQDKTADNKKGGYGTG